MITYKKGSITDATESIIVHGCNAQGRMRSGVAKALREKWPEATWDVYSKKYQQSGLVVGEVIFGKQDDKYIANAITQEFYGYDGKLYLSYDGLREVFKIIDQTYFDIDYGEYADIAMPRIGAGLAGGDWEIILKIIEESFLNRNVVIYDIDQIEIEKEQVTSLNKKLDDSYTEEVIQEPVSDGVISGITPVALGTNNNELEAWHFLFW